MIEVETLKLASVNCHYHVESWSELVGLSDLAISEPEYPIFIWDLQRALKDIEESQWNWGSKWCILLFKNLLEEGYESLVIWMEV